LAPFNSGFQSCKTQFHYQTSAFTRCCIQSDTVRRSSQTSKGRSRFTAPMRPNKSTVQPASFRIVATLNTRRLTPLDTQSIIAELEGERDRLNRAITALQGSQNRRGTTASGKPDGRRRRLSAAARRRIGEAMRKHWAERKKKAAA
jgi:hypothetical protein